MEISSTYRAGRNCWAAVLVAALMPTIVTVRSMLFR
jgi:hypothetical protein